ncbi:hypothetical protein BC829DRAFT_359451 [Chytridium lagenaria]|nr:hypothetical protein BC829DRAFT_359451 [Chytridium lagenaria]
MTSRRLYIVTGASKGFGRAIVLALAKSDIVRQHDTDILCLGRNAAGLVETIRLAKDLHQASIWTESLDFQSADVDFSSLNLDFLCEDILSSYVKQPSMYQSATLINNAGSLGSLTRSRNLTASMIRSAFEVNVVAPMVMTSRFLSKFGSTCDSVTVINISSLAAIEPFDCWGIYSCGKAAREMFHRNVAVEELLIQQEEAATSGELESPIQPRVRTLNYAPGPLNTDMQKNIRDEMPDVPLRSLYVTMHEEGKLVDPNDSARVLVELLDSGNFENGAHIDYYDVLNPTHVGK